MRVHYFQHVEFEGPAIIRRWAADKGYTLTATKFHTNDTLPDVEDIDRLIVLGGPMNIYEEGKYAWLAAEKAFIRKAIAADKTVVGICLGAQLIADVLGARVYRGKNKEIGWFPVELTPAARQTEVFGFLPAWLTAFHWHGDTFPLPENSVHLARSAACDNQAFVYGTRVLGLQFHLEFTEESVRQIVQNCKKEIIAAEFIQSAADILAVEESVYNRMNNAMLGILDRLPGRSGRP